MENSAIELPQYARTYYLDTCVWTALARSESVKADFVSYFMLYDYVAALSYFTLFELSRAPKAFADHDPLFSRMRYNVWIPSLRDLVIESELKNYPKAWTMRWFPVSLLVDESSPNILEKLADDPRFVKSRDDHLQFGYDHFMSLERFKENFPTEYKEHPAPENEEECERYTPDQADSFAWYNTVDYLGRHFVEFLRRFRNKAGEFKVDSLLSLRITSLFLFYKYYIHGQSPGKSDFMDFNHVSYAPYCDVFVTERNVCNVLTRIKNSGLMLADTRVLHISDFLEEISEASTTCD